MRVVGMTSTSVSALNATGLAVEASIGSKITLHVQGSRSFSKSALHLLWSLHLYLRHANHDGGTCYHDLRDDLCTRHVCSCFLRIESAREAFALQCGVFTSAVSFESEPLDGCPSWDLTSKRLQANTSTKAHVKIFLECSDTTDVLCRIFQCLC